MSANFYTVGGGTLVVLFVVAAFLGHRATKHMFGILLDNRGRLSLQRLQIIMWTILVVSTLVGVSVTTLALPEIPTTLLALMGISAGSAVAAGAVKDTKDKDPNARVARAGNHALSNGATREITPKLSQLYLEEEGDGADVTVGMHKFQLLLFTVVLGLIYVLLSANEKGFPDLGNGAVWLTAISHGAYVGGKVPNKQ